MNLPEMELMTDVEAMVRRESGPTLTTPSALPTTEQVEFANNVKQVLTDLGNLLIEKNRKYGNAALKPKRIFSRASNVEQIKTRIDDKLSRLANQQADDDEDAAWDLMGYLVLLRIAQKS